MGITSWPRSAYVAVAVLIAVFAVVAHYLYAETRSAYRAVGFNDGRIHQSEQTMAIIREAVSVVECAHLQALKPPVELLTVKAQSLYMSVTADGAVHFCK